MVKMIEEGKVVAALSTSIRRSWKVGIYYINGSLLILNLAPLYHLYDLLFDGTHIVNFIDSYNLLRVPASFQGISSILLKPFNSANVLKLVKALKACWDQEFFFKNVQALIDGGPEKESVNI